MPSLNYPDAPLHEVMRATARRYPHRTAIRFENRTITFAEFDLESNRLANALHQLGLSEGDRLGIFLPNSPEWELGAYAASKLGAVICPLNPSYRSFEIGHVLNDCGAKILMTHSKLWPFVAAIRQDLPTVAAYVVVGDDVPTSPQVCSYAALVGQQSDAAPNVHVDPDQLAALPYSSGTTGGPKGVMLTHRNLVSNHLQYSTASRLQPDDTYLLYLPLAHIYGFALMGMAMMVGIPQIMMERFDLETAVTLIRENHVTWLHVVPPILMALASAPALDAEQFRSIRYVQNAAAPLAPDLARQVEERLGLTVIQGYGLTEASPCTHHTPLDGGPVILESGGVPLSDTQQRVVDLETGNSDLPTGEIGEIVVRGPQVMKGYWNAPTETARVLRDGWLYTGDIGRIDERGQVFICDRRKDMIKYKGFSIAPAELEAVLFEHPDIADCAVIGVQDPEAGQVPKAFVVPRPGASLAIDTLSAFVHARLAGYKQIRTWEIIEKIPRTPTGKILKRNLKDEPAARP